MEDSAFKGDTFNKYFILAHKPINIDTSENYIASLNQRHSHLIQTQFNDGRPYIYFLPVVAAVGIFYFILRVGLADTKYAEFISILLLITGHFTFLSAVKLSLKLLLGSCCTYHRFTVSSRWKTPDIHTLDYVIQKAKKRI